MSDISIFTWSSAAASDIGNRRKVNEDSYLALPESGLWAVADGMGGYEAGDVASKAIVDAMSAIQRPAKMSAFVDEAEACLLDVNTRLYEESRRADRISGSTVAAFLAAGHYCVVIWAGDSRVYRCRGGRLERLMQDHSEVEDLVSQGLLTPEEAQNHPDSNIITRAVGAEEKLYLDMDIHSVRDGDIFLLCSDGLYREVSETEIAELLSTTADCEETAKALIDLTLTRRARDNVTAVVMQARRNT
ncbi:MAG: serine/threonine-protein phosphatase [Gammaproteobacteria bacterium]|nr:serine/threonine-protein phosphatase [Gammaproteobacteria bacterium]